MAVGVGGDAAARRASATEIGVVAGEDYDAAAGRASDSSEISNIYSFKAVTPGTISTGGKGQRKKRLARLPRSQKGRAKCMKGSAGAEGE